MFLAGCEAPTVSEQPKAPAPEFGRWTIVPALSAPVTVAGTSYLFGWRLDTKTGDLELCTYDPGGWISAVTKMPAPQAVSCTVPDKPN